MEVLVTRHAGNQDDIELSNFKASNRNSPIQAQKKMGKNIQKTLTIMCCTFGIIVSWSIALAPPLIYSTRTIVSPNGSSIISSQTNTLLNELPPINLPNISNYTIYTIYCENRFIYEPKESVCYPPCDWDPSETKMPLIINIIYFIISATGLLLCVGTLISWIAASVKCRGSERGCDFQLARASLSMVVLSKLVLYLLFTCVDALGRNVLVCRTNEYREKYLIAHMTFSLSSSQETRLIVNILGQFYTFWFLSSSLWTIVGFTNIILLVFLPLRTKKKQTITFCIEIGIVIILPICILSVVTGVDPITTFVVNYQSQEVNIRNIIAYIIVIALVYSLTSGYVLTSVIITLTKLRFVSLRSQKITGQGLQLTELEKRMIIYAVVLGLFYAVIGISVVFYAMFENKFIAGVLNYTLCVNVNSPISLIPREYTEMGHNISDTNSTLSVYRGNGTGNVTKCDFVLNELNATAPIWILTIFGIITRVDGILVFIVLIPRCSVRCFRKIFKIS